MCRKELLGAALALLVLPAVAPAQNRLFRGRSRPAATPVARVVPAAGVSQGTVVTAGYNTPAAMPAVGHHHPVYPPHGGSDCVCPTPSGGCPGPCHPPAIAGHHGGIVRVCKDLPYEITPPEGGTVVIKPYYGKPVAFKADVKVPVAVTECLETIEFKDIYLHVGLCVVRVCVPCAICTDKVERCEERTRPEVAVEAYRRRDNCIDVYALNVPGLPKKFILHPRITEDDYKKEFPGKPVPTYP